MMLEDWEKVLADLEVAIARMRVGVTRTSTAECEWYETIEYDAADEIFEIVKDI